MRVVLLAVPALLACNWVLPLAPGGADVVKDSARADASRDLPTLPDQAAPDGGVLPGATPWAKAFGSAGEELAHDLTPWASTAGPARWAARSMTTAPRWLRMDRASTSPVTSGARQTSARAR